MNSDQVVRHDLVYGELLLGDRGTRKEFLTLYAKCKSALTIPHAEVIELVCARKLQGRGVGWIDIHLLASALAAQVQLWTADSRFSLLAHEFGVAYTPPRPVKSQ
jgi:hypothetical protein